MRENCLVFNSLLIELKFSILRRRISFIDFFLFYKNFMKDCFTKCMHFLEKKNLVHKELILLNFLFFFFLRKTFNKIICLYNKNTKNDNLIAF